MHDAFPNRTFRSRFGLIRLHYRKRKRTLTYEQRVVTKLVRRSTASSLDAHIHALYGLALQNPENASFSSAAPAMPLTSMLAQAGRRVSVVDIDPVSFRARPNVTFSCPPAAFGAMWPMDWISSGKLARTLRHTDCRCFRRRKNSGAYDRSDLFRRRALRYLPQRWRRAGGCVHRREIRSDRRSHCGRSSRSAIAPHESWIVVAAIETPLFFPATFVVCSGPGCW